MMIIMQIVIFARDVDIFMILCKEVYVMGQTLWNTVDSESW